jgi:hypothetical protein
MTKDEALKMVIENLELQEFNTVNATLISYCKEALEQNDNLLTIAYMSGVAEGKSKALEQPSQEPVAWMSKMGSFTAIAETKKQLPKGTEPIALYTHPAQSWQGLTDDEILAIPVGSRLSTARAVEQALKEKNHG